MMTCMKPSLCAMLKRRRRLCLALRNFGPSTKCRGLISRLRLSRTGKPGVQTGLSLDMRLLAELLTL